MCLIIDKEKTKELKKKMSKGKKIFYKFYKIDVKNKCLHSPFYNTSEDVFPGTIKPDPVLTDRKISEKFNGNLEVIDVGAIHAWVEKKFAESCAWPGEIVIPVLCKKEDLIAVGDNNDVAFKKIEISKKDFNKVFEE